MLLVHHSVLLLILKQKTTDEKTPEHASAELEEQIRQKEDAKIVKYLTEKTFY